MDIDGDGERDLIVPKSFQEFVNFRGLGDGRFAEGVPVRIVGQPFGVGERVPAFSFADWNGDGRLDLFVGTSLGRVLVLPGSLRGFGPAETVLSEKLLTHSSVSVDAVDFDGDGDVDLVVTHPQGVAQLFENVGTAVAPKLAKPRVLVSADPKYENSRFSLGDLNSDGRLDLLVFRSRRELGEGVSGVPLTLEESATLSRARLRQAELGSRLTDLNHSRPDFRPGPLRLRRTARRDLATAILEQKRIVDSLELQQKGKPGKLNLIPELAVYLRR